MAKSIEFCCGWGFSQDAAGKLTVLPTSPIPGLGGKGKEGRQEGERTDGTLLIG